MTLSLPYFMLDYALAREDGAPKLQQSQSVQVLTAV